MDVPGDDDRSTAAGPDVRDVAVVEPCEVPAAASRDVEQSTRESKEPVRSPRRRSLLALTTNAVSSVGNFSLSIGIAHIGDLRALGHLGVAIAAYVLVTGAVRTAVADSVLTHRFSAELNHRSHSRVLLLGVILGLVTVAVGLGLRQGNLVALGVGLPGICAYDFAKVVSLGTGRPGHALGQEVVWTTATLLAVVLGLTGVLDSTEVFAAWALSCAVIGFVHAALLRYSLVPRWTSGVAETKLSATFALDFLAGTGIGQVTVMAVAVSAGVAVAGTLRGAGTILAPLTIVAATLPSLLIPQLAEARRTGADRALRVARRAMLVLASAAAIVVVGLLLIPSGVGTLILAENWHPARSVLPWTALEMLFTLVASVPFAGHRVEGAGVRALIVRLIRAPFQVAGVIVSAGLYGAQGAAAAMAAVALVGLVTWWISYTRLLRKTRGTSSGPCLPSTAAQ